NGILHADYVNGGRKGWQQFYGLLTDPDMTGAVFNLPEVVMFLPASGVNTTDRAVLRMQYVDKNGNAGRFFTVARQFPGTEGGRGTDWWFYGNQHPIDASVSSLMRQRTQLAPAGAAPF